MSEKKATSSEKPKARLDLNKILEITLKPVANIDTNIGRIFLYPLTIGAIEKYTSSLEASAIERIRKFLPTISSLSPDRKESKLSLNQMAQLSDDEIELISEVYTLSGQFKQLEESEDNKLVVVRNKNESNSEFLDRLLKAEVDKT